jgi:hypothetical protein
MPQSIRVSLRAAFRAALMLLATQLIPIQAAEPAAAGGDLAPSAITAKGFDADRSFMMIEIAGDDMYFETTSRTGVVVDSGVIHRTIRPASGGVAHE